MRVAHIATSISMNQVVLNQLIFQRERGYDVTALCPDDEWAEAIKAEGIRIMEVPLKRHNIPATLVAIARTWIICRQERFHVVHTHNAMPGVAGRIAGWLAGVPVVVHTAHSWPFYDGLPRLTYQTYVTLERFAACFCDAVLFQNHDDLQVGIAHRIVIPSKAIYVGNGIDVLEFTARCNQAYPGEVRRALGLSKESYVITMIARLEPVKGHTMFLEALKEVVASYKQVVALLVGIGFAEDEIRATVQRLGLEEHVYFLGYRTDVPAILRASDLLVLTSKNEGLPRAVLEAMAAGVPVVATNVQGTREVVHHGQTGLLVELGDIPGLVEAIIALIRDRTYAQQLATQAREVVLAEYDERLVADRIEYAYLSVMEAKVVLPEVGRRRLRELQLGLSVRDQVVSTLAGVQK